MAEVVAGILTVSDRVTRGEYEDRGGPAAEEYLKAVIISPMRVVRDVVADEIQDISGALCRLCDTEGCHLVLTTGGTGPAPRDRTPEATARVCHTQLPGFAERMRQVSVEIVPTAMLSRQIVGVRNQSLIVNLPGNPKAISECLDAIFVAIPHCLQLIGGPAVQVTDAQTPPH